MSNISYKFMTFVYRIRDKFLQHSEILREAGLKPGFHVIDYGCGPGGYIAAASDIVGETGKIYAIDINPLAIESARNIVINKNLKNVETILTDCKIQLSDKSIDVVYLFDFFHELEKPDPILYEINRVLKKNGILSLYDPLMKEKNIITKVTNKNSFKYFSKGSKTYSFIKI